MCCGVLMRRAVFSCATTVAPAACGTGSLFIGVIEMPVRIDDCFNGAAEGFDDSSSLGQAGATGRVHHDQPISAVQHDDVAARTRSMVRVVGERLRLDRHGADLGAKCRQGILRLLLPCADGRGISASTTAPAPSAAIIRNHSRRFALVIVRLTVHLFFRGLNLFFSKTERASMSSLSEARGTRA
jgi:hypothetical protein